MYQNGTIRRCRRRSQQGLSLIEVTIALAIATLVSLALFQSVVQWVELSAKTSGAAQRAISTLAYERQFRTIVRGLIPGWKEIEEEEFKGTPEFFSGIATHLLHKGEPALSVVTLQLVNEGNTASLNYLAFETGWTMVKFEDAFARFDYLGADGKWYPNWPPATVPEPGPFKDYEILGVPLLPAAIRLSAISQGEGDRNRVKSMIIAEVLNDPELPHRDKDVLGGVVQ